MNTLHKKGASGSYILRESVPYTLIQLSAHTEILPGKASDALRLVYTETLLAGCGTYSREGFINALALLGSDIRVHSSHDAIEFSVTTRNENLRKTLQIFETMLKKPTLSQKEIVRIKRHLIQNLTLAKEDARPRARDAFINSIVPKEDRRFVYDIDTIIAEIKKVTRTQLIQFHKQVQHATWNYTCGGDPDSCTVTGKTLTRLLSTAREVALYRTVSLPNLEKTIIKILDIPHKQNIEFSIGAPIPLRNTDEDYPALFFGIAVLGIYGGFSGRLMSTVREKEGLTYMIYNQIEGVTATETGFWRIATFFSPKDSIKGITSTLREVRKIVSYGITPDELTRFKKILKTRFGMVEDSLVKKIRDTHTHTEAGLTQEAFENFKSAIQKMTVREVNRALKKYIHPKALVISGAGPIQSIKKEMRSFEHNPRSN